MEYSEYQKNIFKFIKETDQNLYVEARAGSGKSFSIIHSLPYFPEDEEIIISAFNVHIAKAMQAKVSRSNVKVCTANSLGHRILNKNSTFSLSVDQKKYDKIISRVINTQFSDVEKKDQSTLENFVKTLVNFTRLTLSTMPLEELIEYYCLDVPPILEEGVLVTIEGIRSAISSSLSIGKKMYLESGSIDFTDQLYLPHKLNLSLSKKYIVIADECQDFNLAMLMLFHSVSKRFIGVGDRFQSLLGFAGSTPNVWEIGIELFKAETLPLSVCYRCPESHIRLAQEYVKNIRAAEGAIEGNIIEITENQIDKLAKKNDLIICRFNAPLIRLCLRLVIDLKKPAKLRGFEFCTQLINLTKYLLKDMGSFSKEGLLFLVDKYETNELRKSKGEKTDREISDRVSSLSSLINYFCIDRKKHYYLVEFERFIKNLFGNGEEKDYIILSSIHRAKGDEANRVFILQYDSLPVTKLAKNEWQEQQEINLAYVAITRSKEVLYLSSGESNRREVRPKDSKLEIVQIHRGREFQPPVCQKKKSSGRDKYSQIKLPQLLEQIGMTSTEFRNKCKQIDNSRYLNDKDLAGVIRRTLRGNSLSEAIYEQTKWFH